MAVHRYPAQDIRTQIESVLTSWGMAADEVAITADVMVATDLWGVDSHGIQMLEMYEEIRLKAA